MFYKEDGESTFHVLLGQTACLVVVQGGKQGAGRWEAQSWGVKWNWGRAHSKGWLPSAVTFSL